MAKLIPVPTVTNPRPRRSAAQWHALVRKCSVSCETRHQFCARHGVALSTLQWWQRRVRQEAAARATINPRESGAVFVELTKDAPPVAADAPVWDVELELGRGVFLRLRHAAC